MIHSPEILITGLAHSGTTYMVRLLGECGWGLGEDLWTGGQTGHVRTGLEWRPLLRLAVEIEAECGSRGGWYGMEPATRQGLLWEYLPRFQGLDYPRVVKLTYGSALRIVLAALEPRRVVVVTRELGARARSVHAGAQWAQGVGWAGVLVRSAVEMGMMWDFIEDAGHPYSTVRFPRVVEDAQYAWSRLEGVAGVGYETFWEAHERAGRPEWIGYSAARRSA